MKSFTVPCLFGGVRAPFTIYVGEPLADTHPLEQQAAWLVRERGGTVPPDLMDSFTKLQEIAREHNANFEELCEYAINKTGSDAGTADPTEPVASP